MPNKNQSLDDDNIDFNDDPSFFGVKEGKTLNGGQISEGSESKNAAGKVSKLKDDEVEFKFTGEEDGDDDTVTAFASKGKKTKIKEAEEEDDEDENDKDSEDEDDEDDKEEKQVVKKKLSKETTKKGGEEDDDENDDEDDEDDEKKDIKSSKKKESTDDEDEVFFTELAKEFKDRKIFTNVKLAKGEKITEERFFELHDEEIETRVNETIEAIQERLDDEGKKFIDFIMRGGKPSKYIATLSLSSNIENFDPKNEAHASKTIAHHLKTVEKADEEEITDRIAYLKDKGQLEIYATKYKKIDDERKAATQEALVTNQAQTIKDKEQAAKLFNEELVEVLNKTDKVGLFSITATDRKDLKPFFTRATVKVGKDQYVPEFIAEINRIMSGKSAKDKKELLILGKIIKDKFQSKDLEIEVTTKVANKAQSSLKALRQGNPRIAASGAFSKKGLADMSWEENDN